MLTTLYCDASFCPRELVGGWALWLRSERGRHVENGVTPSYCKSSNDAELAAIYAGIYRAMRQWPNTTVILVRSDSDTALRWLMKTHHPSTEGGQRLIQKITDLQHNHGIHFIPRWVKGHRRGTATDIYLNRQVDAMAREVMVNQRKLKI